MPRFNIPDQRVALNPARADAQAFGAGVGDATTNLGGTLGDIGEKIAKQKEKEKSLEYGNAYSENVLALNDALTSISNDSADGSDIAASFDQVVGKYKESVSELPKDWQAKYENLFLNLRLKATGNQSRVKAKYQTDRFENSRNEIVNRVLTGDLGYIEANEALNVSIDALKEYGIDVESLRSETHKMVLQSEFNNSIETLGYTETFKHLDQGKYNALDPNVLRSLRDRAKGKLLSDLEANYKNAASSVSLGVGTQVDIQGAAKTAKDFGELKLAGKFEDLLAVQNETAGFAQLPAENKEDVLNYLADKFRREGLTEEEALRFSAFQQHEKIRSEMFGNGEQWEYYEGLGVLPETGLIDMTTLDQEEMEEVLSNRKADIKTILERDGYKLPLFRKEEIGALHNNINNLPVHDRAGYIGHFADKVGAEAVKEAAKSISPKDSTLAGVMMVASTDVPAAVKIMKGLNQPIKLTATTEDWNSAALEYAKTGLSGSMLDTMMKLGEAYAKQDVADGGGDSSDTPSKTLERLYGEVVDMGNGTQSVQFRNSDGDFISARLQRKAFLQMEHLKLPDTPMYEGTILPMAGIVRSGRVIPISATEFIIQMPDGRSISNAEQQAIKFNMSDLVDQLNPTLKFEELGEWTPLQ